MNSLIQPTDTWMLWAVMIAGTGIAIWLEQAYRWGARLTAPVLALCLAMLLSNARVMPSAADAYDFVGTYLVPLAIPLLLFRADVRQIIRRAGTMFLIFHISTLGTMLGAVLATALLRSQVPSPEHAAGIMTGSYIGGAVNFFALKESFKVDENITGPLLVADNFIMALLFLALLGIAASRFFLQRYPHPHSANVDSADAQKRAAEHWQRKGIGLMDLAKSLAVATLFHQPLARINGPEEIGGYLLYLFLFVIGLPADLMAVLGKVPLFFVFCAIMAATNLIVTLAVGRLLKANLEELLLCVNATIGGPPSAAAMAIASGWPNLVLPGILVGIWGYVIGTPLGLLIGELLLKWR